LSSFQSGVFSACWIGNSIGTITTVAAHSRTVTLVKSAWSFETFLRGEIARADVSRMISASPRTARILIGKLFDQRLITSDSPKGRLGLGFSADAAAHYSPNLDPSGAN
jgi:hypothetical protein